MGEFIDQYDAQANTDALLDNAGVVEARYMYTAFGEVSAVSLDGSTWSAFAWACLFSDDVQPRPKAEDMLTQA